MARERHIFIYHFMHSTVLLCVETHGETETETDAAHDGRAGAWLIVRARGEGASRFHASGSSGPQQAGSNRLMARTRAHARMVAGWSPMHRRRARAPAH